MAHDLTSRSVAFAALGDPTRQAVVALLAKGPRRAGEIAAEFPISAPSVSRHLRVLRRSGLVVEHSHPDDARVRMYHLRPERLEEAATWLAEVRRQATP